MKLNKGKLLLSEPHLADANFIRSVILLVEHDENGSVGFVLNQPLNKTISEVMPDYTSIKNLLHHGGPCERNTLHFIHTAGNIVKDGSEVIKGLYWGGDHQQLLEGMLAGKIKENQVKFFVGYSGWGELQLQAEIDMNSWIIATPKLPQIFETDSKLLWKLILQGMGTHSKYNIISNAPLDPNWN